MAVYRVKMRWSGFTGAPGYTVLHFDAPTGATTAGAQDVYDQVHTFATNIASNIPTVARLNVESNVDVIDQTTAELQTVLGVTAGAAVAGTGTGGFSSATGACITWETGEVRNGRRVRGRTFVVPMAGQMYDADGTIMGGSLLDLQSAATALAGGGFSFGVLARPSAKGAADGGFYTVTSGRITDKTAILRSRRD